MEAKRKTAKRMGPYSSMAMMMLLPWVYFFAALCLFSLRYHHHAWEVWCDLGLGFFIAVLIMVSDPSGDGGSWFSYLGFLCIFGQISGSIAGLYNYQANSFRYWAFEEYRSYTNVLPSELAKSHMDAGFIRFAEEAHVDTTRTVGFKAGHIFCVAPILDDSGPGTPVEYWAAGKDCCQKRSKFKCDDVWNAFSKSGVVMREAGGMVPSDRHFYMKAVRESSSTYDLVSAPEPIFVSWVLDPKALRDGFWSEAQHVILVAGLVYLLSSLIFGVVMNYAAKQGKTRKPRS